jgi:CBS domain containing-hemolysin-like protein
MIVIDLFPGALIVFVLFLINLLLAGARSAFVNSRLVKLQSLSEGGNWSARLAARIAAEARRLILSLRVALGLFRLLVVGTSLAAFGLPLQSSGVPGIVVLTAVLLMTGIVLSLSEFVMENISLRAPERWAIRYAPLVYTVEVLFTPVRWIMSRLARWITGGLQRRAHPVITEEEIMTLVDAGEEEGVIEEEEKAMIYSIFQLADTLAREVMVPRIDVLAFEENISLIEATEELLRTGYSRAPVYSGSIDNIVGILYAKDLLAAWRDGAQDSQVSTLCREAYFVPEAKKVDDLLTELQAKRVHLAIVVDEYGGTAGLVTIEDIVEEIIGEIRDEYDFEEELPFEVLPEGEFRFSGRIDLDDVNQLAEAHLPKDTSETLGGFIYSHLGKVPAVGEQIQAGGLHLTVEEVIGRRIRKVRARKVEDASPEVDEHGNHSGNP